MKPGTKKRACAAAVLAALAPAAHGEDLIGDWSVSGFNTARAEHYRIRGDQFGGPYAFGGRQLFDEFNLNFVRNVSDFDKWRAQIYGVFNDSAYRASDRGFVPERLNVVREDGAAALPYRVEAGDFFGNFSYRTLQRSLKGGQVELQPASTGPIRQSILVVSGVEEASWRHLHGTRNWTNGASWLVELDPQQHFSANVVHNRRQADDQSGTPERKQTVASLTTDYGWVAQQHKLRFEGEIAALRGDHEGFSDATGAIVPGSGTDRHGQGVFAQLSGAPVGGPYDYRLRFERYDHDFRPAEGSITSDRRSEEGYFGWAFRSGLSARLRAQHYVDGLQSENELKTTTYGGTVSGPFGAGVSGNVDVSRQELQKRDATVDRSVWTATADLSKSLPAQWTGSLSAFWQQLDDRVAGAPDSRTARVQLAATHAVDLAGWKGTFSPGIVLRRVSGASDAVREVSPSIALVVSRNNHAIEAGYGYQRLRPDDASLATVDLNTLYFNYRCAVTQRDIVGIETSAYDRRVTVGQFNETYRVSLFWTHQFGGPAQLMARAPLAAVAATGPLPRDVGVLLAIAPGMDMGAVRSRLEDAGYRGAVPQGNAVVFETRLIGDVEARQRLAVVQDAGRVARTALLIDIDDAANAAAVSQVYERARKALLDRFGNPSLAFEEGNFGPAMVVDLNAGRFVRVMEWRTQAGTLRLGIPRRLDGRLRIEIQHAAGFPPPRDLSWGLDIVR